MTRTACIVTYRYHTHTDEDLNNLVALVMKCARAGNVVPVFLFFYFVLLDPVDIAAGEIERCSRANVCLVRWFFA